MQEIISVMSAMYETLPVAPSLIITSRDPTHGTAARQGFMQASIPAMRSAQVAFSSSHDAIRGRIAISFRHRNCRSKKVRIGE